MSPERSGLSEGGGAGHIRLSIICDTVLLEGGESMKQVRTVRLSMVAEWSKSSSCLHSKSETLVSLTSIISSPIFSWLFCVIPSCISVMITELNLLSSPQWGVHVTPAVNKYFKK